MPVRVVTWLSLYLTALSMGGGFSHVLQASGKASWDGPFWRLAMETLYRDYATAGAVTELGAIAATAALAFLLWRTTAFKPVLAAALLLAAAFFGLWLWFIAPINARFATWSPDAMPADWRLWRDRWEFWHAVIFSVKSLAFAILAGVATSAFCNRERMAP